MGSIKFRAVLRNAIASIALCFLAVFAHAGGTQPDYNPTQVIVQLNSAADLAAVAAQYNLNPTPLFAFSV